MGSRKEEIDPSLSQRPGSCKEWRSRQGKMEVNTINHCCSTSTPKEYRAHTT